MESIITIIALLLGWSLSEFSKRRERSSDDKRNLGIAILSILELRFRLTHSLNALDAIDDFFGASKPEKIERLIKTIKGGKTNKPLSSQYLIVCENVAKMDPVLAYKMNGLLTVLEYFDALEGHNASKKHMPDEVLSTAIKAIELVIPTLESFLLQVAALHSKKTASNVEKLMLSKGDDSYKEELQEFMSSYKSGIERIKNKVVNNA